MYKDDKKYHMDLKENARGRFLKVSETFTRGYSRFQVRIIIIRYGTLGTGTLGRYVIIAGPDPLTSCLTSVVGTYSVADPD